MAVKKGRPGKRAKSRRGLAVTAPDAEPSAIEQRRGKLTPAVISAIVEAHATGLTTTESCHMHGVSMVGFWRYRRAHAEDEAFAARWADAEESFTQTLEERAFALAKQSDVRFCTMLIFMLKARRPEVYKDNVNHTGKITHEFASDFAAAMANVLPDNASAVH